VIGVDLTEAMIGLARRGSSGGETYETGDMGALRFDDETVDVLTGGYALRNAPDLAATLMKRGFDVTASNFCFAGFAEWILARKTR
jgi:demethylmenaquinone methyltransferase/2-methoxy-6-polyprenyl-1,4-benzoquinol methylase